MIRMSTFFVFALCIIAFAGAANATNYFQPSIPSATDPMPTLPFVTPEMYGAVGDGATDDHVALNNATAAACSNKITLFLDKSYSIGSTTWNMTSGAGCNGGLTIIGNGDNATIITYKAASNNTGVAWDMTGAAYVNATGFAVYGGTKGASNSPNVTLLLGAANSSGFIFSGLMRFTSVFISNAQGSWVMVDNGAEQLDFVDCTAQAMGTSSDGIQFVSSGSAPSISSSIVTTNSPVASMTDVHWHGAKGALLFYGFYGVIFHFSGTGAAQGIADIHFDDFGESFTPAGTQFKFMSDDSGGAANTVLTNVGGSRLELQNNGANGAMTIGNFSAARVDQIEFDGAFYWHGGTVTNNPFVFGAATTLTNSRFSWNPNNSGTWTGTEIVQVPTGTLVNGVDVRAPYPKAMLLNGGATLNSYIIQGTDGTVVH